jgi:hypothetical protein
MCSDLYYALNYYNTITFGHINQSAPDPVRSRKLSWFELSQ